MSLTRLTSIGKGLYNCILKRNAVTPCIQIILLDLYSDPKHALVTLLIHA